MNDKAESRRYNAPSNLDSLTFSLNKESQMQLESISNLGL
jgi:hypothetical protein